MKSEKGITLTSLIIYIIAMAIVIGIVATITNYFYNNIDGLTDRTESSKSYTTFNSYFVNEITQKDNTVLSCTGSIIVFSSGNQYTFAGGDLYMNKIKICRDAIRKFFV